MKIILVIIMVLITTISYADRVCIRKSDGVPIETQSGDAPLGTLLENRIRAGQNPDDYTEEYMSARDIKLLYKVKKEDPAKAIKDAEKTVKDAAARNKLKLKLSDGEIEALKVLIN